MYFTVDANHGASITTMVAGSSRKHGPAISAPFDRWFRYPAGFSESTLDLCFRKVSALSDSKELRLSDAFAGVATVGSRCRRDGHGFLGIETHPLIQMVGNLKLQEVDEDPNDLVSTAKSIVADAEIGDPATETDLLQRSFDREVLAQLVGLRAAIREEGGPWGQYLELALLSSIRDLAKVKVGWPYQLPSKERQPRATDPGARFLRGCQWIAEDLEAAGPSTGRVVLGDSRSYSAWKTVKSREINAQVSSPPYLNNFDYADATRIEVNFWGLARTWKEMCDTVRRDMVTASTQQSKLPDAEKALRKLEKLPTFSSTFEPLFERLTTERERRKSRKGTLGKHYNWMAAIYFQDISRVLEHTAKSLVTDSPVLWVVGDSAPYGVYLDTPKLLTVLAQDLGFEAIEDTKIRTRGQRWRTNGTRHQVELSERLVAWRAPGPPS